MSVNHLHDWGAMCIIFFPIELKLCFHYRHNLGNGVNYIIEVQRWKCIWKNYLVHFMENHLLTSLCMLIFNEKFFHVFVFIERICFKLRVMILAVEMTHTDENGSARVFVEVAPKDDCIILCGTRAFMVCSSSEDAKRFN